MGGHLVVCLPVASPFDPQDVLDARLLARLAVIAEPAALRHLDVQTLLVEGGGTRLAAQETSPCVYTHTHTHTHTHRVTFHVFLFILLCFLTAEILGSVMTHEHTEANLENTKMYVKKMINLENPTSATIYLFSRCIYPKLLRFFLFLFLF